ncbi:Vacuolar amino acid transporter [Drechslerella dactyloides]|uniref:Vacuolar amino acid transporter n=1 Tax=Drechslerella dactyloides TaxID=74499 RepID=A0AAD6J739_DREDA|nr:Vacuolar amino acid transporter [Drechslerella dactyloides]
MAYTMSGTDDYAVESGSPSQSHPLDPGSFGGRRRSFVDHLIHDVGGVNSIENYARSYVRAVGFHELARSPSNWAGFPSDDEDEQRDDEEEAAGDGLQEESAASAALHPAFLDYGTSPGTKLGDAHLRQQASRLYISRQGSLASRMEAEPLLVRKASITDENGKTVTINMAVGQSTIYQTIFNSINTLVGIGLLSLPLGFRLSGWIIGVLFMIFSMASTAYTAKLIAACMESNPVLITYGDIAWAAFGRKGRVIISVIFFLELLAACVALVILFADSLHALIPDVSIITWKLLCGLILTPLCFLPLRLLSVTSILGIICTFSIVGMIFASGLVTKEQPGSLIHPAKTYLLPEHWGQVPLSLGILISPWGGHSVFPNIYRDMRHPYKFGKAIKVTYTFTADILQFILDLSMAVVGYLLFGDSVRDIVTSNILLNPQTSQKLSIALISFIAAIPITKTPLNARPIISTFEVLLGIDQRALAPGEEAVGMTPFMRGLYNVLIRVGCVFSFITIAILVPSFERIMALMGSALCFLICIILPLMFRLRIFAGKLSRGTIILDWCLIVFSSLLAIAGTVTAILPRELLIGKK